MKIFCKELNKSFENKEDMFKELVSNKSLIIDEKKTHTYKAVEKGISVISNQKNIIKNIETEKSLKLDSDYYFFVVNSSNILDSHSDMHVKGNWEKTVNEQQGNLYLVFDHELKRSEIIAMKEDVEILTAEIPFSSLGKNYEGSSYCLVYKVRKDKIINDDAIKFLEKGYSLEASVRMKYIRIELAIDSNDEEFSKEKEIFDLYYPQIANKSDFYNKIDYFWIVKEARNVSESSLVMFGSNNATGLIQEKTPQAEKSPEEKEEVAEKSPLQEQKKYIYHN